MISHFTSEQLPSGSPAMFDDPHDRLKGDVEVEPPFPVEDDPVGAVDPADRLLRTVPSE